MTEPQLRRFLELASRRLIDSRVGVIRSIAELPVAAGGAGLFQFSARARDLQARAIDTGGAATTREVALAKTIGEAVERYCASFQAPGRVVRISLRQASFRAVPPEQFRLYSPAQLAQRGFPLTDLETDPHIGWVEARELDSNESWFVPASKVYVPYDADVANGERLVFQDITTGLACHQDFERAALGAICEVVERDAFTITWQARLSPPLVRTASLDPELRELAQRYERDGSELRILNITLDVGVPTMLVTLRSHTTGMPALVFSAATDLDPRVALRKCLEELQLMRSFARWVMATRGEFQGTAEQVHSREDHVNFYCSRQRAAMADFLFDSPVRQDLQDIPTLASGDPVRDLATLRERVCATGERILLVDLTSDDIAGLGLSVLRAVIPGFHPLVFGHPLRALACPRRWLVPRALGYQAPGPEQPDNPAPHPFP